METALVGAMIAAGAAVAAAVVSWFGAFQSRRAADRDHAWRRFVWALEVRQDHPQYDISKTVLQGLEEVAWWSEADRRLAKRALRRAIAADVRAASPPAPAPGRTDTDAPPTPPRRS